MFTFLWLASKLYFLFFIYVVSSNPASTINISINAVQTTVKQGENITVICEVRDFELIDYTWTYPGLLVSKHLSFLGIYFLGILYLPSLCLHCVFNSPYWSLQVGKKVTPDTKFLPGLNHHTSSTLTIHNAGPEDEGLYICMATDTYHGQDETKEKYIKVIGMFVKMFACHQPEMLRF